MKKKILFVYDCMMTGGTSTALLSLMNKMDPDRYEIHLLLYTNTGAFFGDIPDHVRILEPAYKASRLLSSGQRKIIRTALNGRMLQAWKAYRKYRNTPKGNLRHILMHYGMAAQVSLSRCIDEAYDCAIGFMEGWANEYVASSKIRAKKKIVWIHPQYESCYLIPEIDRKTFSAVDHVVLVSENCRQSFLTYFPECEEKVRIVPNIVSPQLLRKKAEKENVTIRKAKINFCTVCRCDVRVKGLDRLLKVFCSLKEQGLCKDVLWHLVGGGGDFASFQEEVKRLGMEDTVVLYGEQQNPLPYLLHMDAFVLASRYEGKPVAVTEAQILGLPCLVTNYLSAPSQVKHGENGMIMENSYDSIYEGMKTVIQNPALLAQWRVNTAAGSYGNEQDIERFYALLDREEAQKKEG